MGYTLLSVSFLATQTSPPSAAHISLLFNMQLQHCSLAVVFAVFPFLSSVNSRAVLVDDTKATLPSSQRVAGSRDELDRCTLIPGICDIPTHNAPSPPAPSASSTPRDRSEDLGLHAGAGDAEKYAPLGSFERMRIVFPAYPSLRNVLDGEIDFAGRVSRRIWRFDAQQKQGGLITIEDVLIIPQKVPQATEGRDVEVDHVLNVW